MKVRLRPQIAASALFAALSLSVFALPSLSAEQPSQQPGSPADAQPASAWQAELAGEPAVDKSSKHKIVRVLKGVGRELDADVDATGKDMVFVFSSRDIDPYERKKPPKDRPYTFATFSLVDGTTAKLVKFPDGSGRIYGGYVNGTVLIPDGKRQWTVKYPNGAQGQLKELSADTLKLQRPDNSVTTFTRDSDGSYRIANDQLGYLGDVNPEGTGYSFQLK